VRPVLSIIVQRQTAQAAESLTGSVEPRYQVDLGFQTPGRMLSRNANVGDRVVKGQQLATVDPTVQRQAVVAAQAQLVNAEAVKTNAEATFERKRSLAATGTGTQADLDAATASRDSARASVDEAKASLQKAIEQLAYTYLISGYDGVIVAWPAEVGEVVAVGQAIVTIARPNPRDAVFDVPDDKLGAFPPGAVFPVSLLAAADITAQATVREIAPQSDAATRTRRIRLTLNNPSQAFRLGTTIRLVVATGQPGQIEIPADAVLDEGGATRVWLVGTDSKVVQRRLTLGARDGDRVVVTGGLSGGERLIVVGIHSLSDGQQVKVPEALETPS
jgi:RND family efflux transporter MFP subunit